MVTDCPFCRIVAGDIPAEVLHSTEDVLAFRDLHPAAPTHVLISPKKHVESIEQLTEHQAPLLSHLFNAANHVARAEGLRDDATLQPVVARIAQSLRRIRRRPDHEHRA